ncbi:hypothetical protein BT93_L0799 [Corymbia citriodora subsp. variegata]|uniref:Leucine-rich repeat-containing N-terminal plant-type domain-containing protein n=1 Tax=Corymbia citriodora subsp. variegata TaxID=360336 RepID=A0A8T0CP69_CORYI|nr:hypothetical protein BT93_L0799 [Corymbia citriodora subsp. variegata]
MAALSLYLLLSWVFLLAFFRTRLAEVLCHEDESSALMEFKRSFRMNTTYGWQCIYPKVHSWSLDGSGDCCSWGGVKCDEVTGRVIALDLSSSCLSGTMSPNTTLFRLVHLESLNLAFNSFDSSPIPYGFSNLSRLQYLNLSHSNFSGEIPHDISQLSKLISLDLSYNWEEPLHLPNMGDFVHNLTGLKKLDLSYVNLSSPLPSILANFSSLTLLKLFNCGLNGEFPVSIFQLPNLEVLWVDDNPNLSGFFPKSHWDSPLKSLEISSTSFSGEIPTSIGNLSYLTELMLDGNNLQGQIPVSFANLTQLSVLWLSSNNLSSDTLEWVVNLTKLTFLGISDNRLSGGLPSSFENLKQLECLDLSHNDLHGDIPSTLWNLKNLQRLFLDSLNLNGTLDANDLFKLGSLKSLYLSYNNISFAKTFINATSSKLLRLCLDSCSLTEFPQFIGYLSELVVLQLQHNKIRGAIPRWMRNNSRESLYHANLSDSLLTSFESNQTNLPLPNLRYLDISSNLLETILPVPPPLVEVYNISNNFLFGEIPTSICEVISLTVLDLSNNNLNGKIPPCLGSIGRLTLLNLVRNKFHGVIPHVYLNSCTLEMIDLRENQLRGIVPRSLGNCQMLEFLNLGDNQINDTFPFWLSKLAYLKVIILQSNKFHGPIEGHLSQLNFTGLHILDLSNNNFNGKLPSKLIQSCHTMKVIDGQDMLAYMTIFQTINMSSTSSMEFYMTYKMKLMNKGMEREYEKISTILMAIDLSHNKFEGSIPKLIGDLKSLRMLNLSHNFLNGSIPSSLANLTMLESLDLSLNNLEGEIPQQLANLTFLEVFDVSHNQLSGPIPRGTQFDTFGSSSFAMNAGLCGSPLPNKCTNGDNAPPPSSFKVDSEEESPFNLDWKIMIVGAGVGFLVGVVLGSLIIDEKSRWFLHFSKRMAKGWNR